MRSALAMEFEIGSQWKTRGGWRAVIVAINNGSLTVWHADTDSTTIHNLSGKGLNVSSEGKDIIDLWVDPVEGEFWVNVISMVRTGKIKCSPAFLTKKEADNVVYDRLACVKVPFTEGEGLNE